MQNNNLPLEIERKFLIKKPGEAEFSKLNIVSESLIEQIYLKSENKAAGERIRKRVFENKISYTHTLKQKITNVKRIEIENEITKEKYEALKQRKDENLNIIFKKRYVFEYEGQFFEMDVFDFWGDVCFLELELKSEEQEISFPPYIHIIAEVTEDRRFTNRSIAKAIPDISNYINI